MKLWIKLNWSGDFVEVPMRDRIFWENELMHGCVIVSETQP